MTNTKGKISINSKTIAEFDTLDWSKFSYNFDNIEKLTVIPWTNYYCCDCWDCCDCGEGWLFSTANHYLSCDSEDIVEVTL